MLQADTSNNEAAKLGLLVALAIVTAGFLLQLTRALRQRAQEGDSVKPGLAISVVSFIANFFDTLGIGSFATTTTMVRQLKLIPDERLAGSLNIGYVIPTVAQAFIYTKIVPVDPMVLILMIAASVLGAWLGAGVVAKWPRRSLQLGMGIALLIFALIMFLGQPQIGLLPTGGEALSLSGPKLGLAVVGNFILGALMTLGIGLYAPCMILIYLLGMKPTAAFPIMMGSCAFLMPLASMRFLKERFYEPKAILGMALAGLPAVLIAAFLVTSLPLTMLKWLVVVVVTYTGTSLIRAARRERDIASQATAAEAQPIT